MISRDIAYHGTTMGALSITGVPAIKNVFEPLVPGRVRVPNTNFYRAPEHGDDLEPFGRWAADEIERAILREGPESVAAVFLEPVQNSGGCFPPPPGYFQRVREICDRYGVLLVSDEVICAFGRLGHWFGAERYGYQPDIITVAKGMTPRLRADRRDDRLATGSSSRSCTARRRSCTASPSAATRCPARSRWPTSTSSSARTCSSTCAPTRPRSAPRSRQLCDLPIVGDVRGDGYFYGIELVKDKATKETFDDDESERLLRGFLSGALFEAGLICRADDRGDPVIQLAPPLICDQSQFD